VDGDCVSRRAQWAVARAEPRSGQLRVKLDLIVVPHQSQNGPKEVKYLAGDGTGGFAAPVSVPLECAPTFVALGRIDSDDILDLAATCIDGRVLTMAGNLQAACLVLFPSRCRHER
jgi:hypothetical protein